MPPALETAAARGPPEVRAMPASIMGYLMPRSLHSGVVNGGGGEDIFFCRIGRYDCTVRNLIDYRGMMKKRNYGFIQGKLIGHRWVTDVQM
jgi:hypothetical protein